MKDRWALCALGAWLMGSVIMILVATRNFRLVDELLQASPNAHFQELVQRWGPGPTRDLLRYLSSELNREYFQLWNIVQLVLGSALLLLLARRGSHAGARRLLTAATFLVLSVSLTLAPRITAVGRSLDFLPHEPAPPELQHFWRLHITYTVLELAKLVLLGLAAIWLARRKGSSSALAPALPELAPSEEST
jgi:hypothetical protein